MVVNTPSNSLVSPYLNTGTIDLTGNGVLRLENNQYQTTPYRTADLGTIIDPGARVFINEYSVIDNAGATLVIDGTTSWSLTTRSQIVGGTIQVDDTAKFVVNGGILRDVTVNGNSTDNFNDLVLVGEVDFNGNVAGKLQFGQAPLFPGAPPLFPDVPLIIRGGNFDLGRRSITGFSGTPSVTLEADVVFKGYASSATFTSPLTNRGQIIASPFSGVFFDADRLFHFTAAPITNEGTLTAINRGILRINNLAAPSSGVVSAAVDSTVEFTGAFAQTAAGTTRIDIGGTASTQFGLVVVGATATLAGKLDVRFASGYTPTVGSRYQVLNYASRTGQFSSIQITGLANGLVVTPEYNGTNMTLVVSAGGSSSAMGQASPSSTAGRNPIMSAGLDQLLADNSASRLLLATAKSSRSVAGYTDFFAVSDLGNQSSVRLGPSDDYSLASELESRDDGSDAVDEAFEHLGDELLFASL